MLVQEQVMKICGVVSKYKYCSASAVAITAILVSSEHCSVIAQIEVCINYEHCSSIAVASTAVLVQ